MFLHELRICFLGYCMNLWQITLRPLLSSGRWELTFEEYRFNKEVGGVLYQRGPLVPEKRSGPICHGGPFVMEAHR